MIQTQRCLILTLCFSTAWFSSSTDPLRAQDSDKQKQNVVVRNENPAAEVPSGEGWKSLFDGKNLDGWQQKNGWAVYRIDGNSIHGTTSKNSPNSFLCTTKDYSDFELKFEVKVHNALNSGVQIRS